MGCGMADRAAGPQIEADLRRFVVENVVGQKIVMEAGVLRLRQDGGWARTRRILGFHDRGGVPTAGPGPLNSASGYARSTPREGADQGRDELYAEVIAYLARTAVHFPEPAPSNSTCPAIESPSTFPANAPCILLPSIVIVTTKEISFSLTCPSSGEAP